MKAIIITAIVTFIITAVVTVIATLWWTNRHDGCYHKRRKRVAAGRASSTVKRAQDNVADEHQSHNDKKDKVRSNTQKIEVARPTEKRDGELVAVPEKDQPQGEIHFSKEEQKLQDKKRKQNPKTTKPDNVVYTNLTVSEGRLSPLKVGYHQYYRSWENEGRFFFEFYSEQKEAMAINNHSAMIDPFCQNSDDSVPFNEASQVVTKEYGEIDNNYTLISKSSIRLK